MGEPPPLDTTKITALLIAGVWNDLLPGSVPFLFENPRFADPFGGPPKTVGGQWFWWTDTQGRAHGTPTPAVQDARWQPPQVTSLTPGNGPEAGGTTVVIAGTGLAGAAAVRFGPAPAAFSADSDAQITAVSPPGTGTVQVTVTTTGGSSSAGPAAQFSYDPPPP